MSTDSLFIYRASELGGCDKALIAKRLGYEPDRSVFGKDKRTGMIMEEGNLHEEAIVAKYRDNGRTITLQQHECNLRIMDGVIVQGHLDGVIQDPVIQDDRTTTYDLHGKVLEIKSMGDSSFKEFKKHGMNTPGLIQKYKWQISAYMIAMERPALLVCKNRNTGEIIETQIDTPPYSYQDIKTRIVLLEAAARTGDLPTKCSNIQYPCPFYFLHEEEEPDFIIDTAVDSFVKVYQEAKDEENRAKAKGKLARERILQLSNGKKLETPNSKVSFYTRKGKKIDWDRIVEDYEIDISRYEVSTESEPIMRITDKKKKDGDNDSGNQSNESGTQISLFGTGS